MGTKTTKTIKKKILVQNKSVTVKKNRLFIVDHPASTPSLYTFVYSSAFSFFCTGLLISSFLLQGVVTVYADNSPDASADVPVAIAEVVNESIINEGPSLTETVVNEPNNETMTLTEDHQSRNDDTSIAVASQLHNVAIGSDTEVGLNLEIETSLSTEIPPSIIDDVDSSSTSTSVTSGGFSEVDNDTSSGSEGTDLISQPYVATSTDHSLSKDDVVTTDVLATEVASQSATSTGTSTGAIHINYDDNQFKFNKQECTELASGSFYCLKPHETGMEDALFAAPDADGDLEIFLIRDGKQVQITNNTVDDASPFYDQNSNSLVWHKLIDDRYQIISYDLDDRKERQLTAGATNNMEPVRQGKYTVWQRWIGSGWDVVLHDGNKEEVLTESSAHDIAPYIHGSLVVWNRYNSSQEKTIEMFDIKSATYVSVNDPEGLSVSNPRMVFVYDSLHPNGDIVTKGFDMITKEFISLDTLPRSLPEELPPIDSTGETRALIQSKPTVKSEVEELGVSTSTPGIIPIIDEVDPLTLDLGLASSSPQVMQEPVVELAALTLDLSLATTTAIASSSISDFELVITPYNQP